MYQAIANDGVRSPLTLVTGCTYPDGTVTHLPATQGQKVVSASAAQDVIHSLENVASQGYLQKALTIPGYRLAAKTGTAEVEENGTYGSDRIITIAGVAPADDPQFVVVVTFGKPVTLKGSFAVAPTFRAIMNQVLTTYRVPPSTTPAPSIPLTW
jgi:cell division protein FtsI (penicillin-binding protein 3)